jgi:hypothetical protein
VAGQGGTLGAMAGNVSTTRMRGGMYPHAAALVAAEAMRRAAPSLPSARQLDELARVSERVRRVTTSHTTFAKKQAAKAEHLRSLALLDTSWISPASKYLDQRVESFTVTAKALGRLRRVAIAPPVRPTPVAVRSARMDVGTLTSAPGAPPATSRPQFFEGLRAAAA